ncbi:ferric reductase transmembrane protein [Trypanosoma conorhini]|uniref:Ferric reductase transmembrane protein n=1 Tax=Trypanosoma conorhini TaxID=83891 RepID=A0A3R7KWV7_9TRYP|nr:ferric reductase transmembrane protein [Trypanosoma conorhini]RNF16761.1 ferric reductase transmembrane protein [Trypanosoma conorhini]
MEQSQPPAKLPAPTEQSLFANEVQGVVSGGNSAVQFVSTNLWMRRLSSVLVLIVFVFFIASSSRTLWTDVFVYHPILMSIAFFVIVPELLCSIAALQGYLRELRPRHDVLLFHRRCALALKVVSAVGIVATEWSKFQRSKMHFVTWHARIGGVCELSQVMEVLIGLIIYYGILDHRLTISQRARLRLAHRCLGVTVVVTGAISMALGMLSHFALRAFGMLFLRLVFAVLPSTFAIWGYFGSY